jgi:hypothetical protein
MVNMAGLKEVDVKDTDTFHPASEIYYPEILRTCPLPTSSCNITTSSVSENVYYKEESDSGLIPAKFVQS